MTSTLVVTAGGLPSRFSTQLVADADGVLYLFGGRGEDGVYADLRRLDPLAAKRGAIASKPPAVPRWSKFSGGMAPANRWGAGFVGAGTELYLFGGALNMTIEGVTPKLSSLHSDVRSVSAFLQLLPSTT